MTIRNATRERLLHAWRPPALPARRPIAPRRLAALLQAAALALAALASPVGAQLPDPARDGTVDAAVDGPGSALAAGAFVRAAPLPAWADPLPLPSAAASRRAVTLRLDDTQLWLAATPVRFVNVAQQVDDPGALGRIGQIALPFVPQFQRLLLHKVAIVRGERVIDHTASVAVRFLQRETGLERGLYSGVVTATLVLPDVRVGDTLLLQYSIEGQNPIFGGRYVEATAWQHAEPVRQQRVTLIHPAARHVDWRWVGGAATDARIEPVTTTRDGLTRLRFEAHDLPGVELEPMTPRDAFPLQWLQFSEFGDWAAVARWADALFPADAPLPAELAALAQQLARKPSRDEQASLALQWVQSQIRYLSVSLGESSHRPHAPAEVLRNRYGDCKDKSLLLMRLLHALGIPARAVLASLGAPHGAARMLASPAAFDHVVVQARIDGRDFYLDPTRLGQRGPLDRLGQGLEGASVLVVDGRDTNALTVVRSPNRAELFRSELTETFRIDAFDADGRLETEQRWVGLGAEAMRLGAARLDTERLQRQLLAGLERRYPGIAADGAPEVIDEVDRNRITVRARYRVPGLAQRVGARWTLRFAPANLQGAIAVPPSAQRRAPLVLPAFPVTVVYRAESHWPSASIDAAAATRTQRFDGPAFQASVAHAVEHDVARAEVVFEPLTDRVEASDVPAMLQSVRAFERGIGGAISVALHGARGARGAAPDAASTGRAEPAERASRFNPHEQ